MATPITTAAPASTATARYPINVFVCVSAALFASRDPVSPYCTADRACVQSGAFQVPNRGLTVVRSAAYSYGRRAHRRSLDDDRVHESPTRSSAQRSPIDTG